MRKLYLLSTVMILALILTACPAPAPPAAGEPAAESAATAEPAAEGGEAAGEPIRIGGMYNVTGGMSSIDDPGLNGMLLKAMQINEAGGVLGQPIEIIAIDGKSDQTTVTNAVS